jgi:hypothetical protein
MESTIKIWLSKTGKAFFKHLDFEVFVNGTFYGTVNYASNCMRIKQPPGEYTVEIKHRNSSISKKMFISSSKSKTVNIYPSWSHPLSKGLLVSICISSAVMQTLWLEKVNILFAILSILPIFTFWSSKPERFSLVVQDRFHY